MERDRNRATRIACELSTELAVTKWSSYLNVEKRLRAAVQSYWDARAANKEKQLEGGKIDAGTRSEVTSGTQMGAMEVLVAEILCEAGLKTRNVRTRTALELPGYYRSEKKWDLIVMSNGQVVTVIEFKSQVGPSFGNNFNNRCEEAIGSATDIWVASRGAIWKKSGSIHRVLLLVGKLREGSFASEERRTLF